MRMTAGVQTLQSVSPHTIAAVRILQYGNQELSEYLENLSYENPVVELEEPERQDVSPAGQAAADLLRWLRAGDRQNRTYYSSEGHDHPDQYLPAETGEYLSDFLKEQILTLDVPPAIRTAMETAADLLDERGLFPGSSLEIASITGCTAEEAEEALHRVRCLEPVGVAADSVRSALLLQLERLDKPVALRMLAEHYDHLGAWSDRRIARAMGVSEEAVAAAKAVIASLSPYPSGGFASKEKTLYVTPDLSITELDGSLTVTVEEAYLPRVHISGAYLRMLETEQDEAVQTYLREKFQQVRQVMGNLSRRNTTLQRCGEVIAARQAEFLRGGALCALTLQDVAEELELHESTVSRAVRHKYVQCSRGMLPMSAFFSREAGQNPGVSRGSVQELIAEIIRGEDQAHPLSDERIAAELDRRHIRLSRRAVAKYRAELGLPTASGRKRESSRRRVR